MTYSIRHDAYYHDMAKEMLRYAGFQETVNDVLRYIAEHGAYGYDHQQWCDDLYQIYGDAQVME